MRKVELTISKDYVPSWGVAEAVRELFQNAIDQEKQDPDNKMSYNYDPTTGVLTLCNEKSTLETRSLLLGATSKEGKQDLVGQYGEGYKLAALVLARQGKSMIIYNYGKREVWRPRFVKSRRFGTDVLTFFIDKKHVWDSVPDNNLTVTVSGITQAEWYSNIEPAMLFLQAENERAELFSCALGQVLKHPAQTGKVYIEGLFVCTHAPYEYGYNFTAGNLKLDRDRKLASDFDLQWLASRMWAESKYHGPELYKLLEDDKADVRFVSSMHRGAHVLDEAYNKFVEKYGANAVPVSRQEELERVPSKYRPVLVSANYHSVLTGSRYYVDRIPEGKSDLGKWWDKYYLYLPEEARKEFESITGETHEEETDED